jgi:Mn2+/Fe2+ NRAMP family transporter
MDTLLDIGVVILSLIPLILLLYVPALLGMATWRERGEGYRVKAYLWFAIGFGAIVAVHVMLRSVSAVQIAEVIGLSLVQATIALGLARLTVYRLAD